MIQQEILNAGVKHHADVDSSDRKRRMYEDFEGIFRRILEQAAIKHPPMAIEVPGRIHNLYVNYAVVGEKFSFEDNKMELAWVGQLVSSDGNRKELGNISTTDIVSNASNSIMQAFKGLLNPFREGRDEGTSGFKLKNDGNKIENPIWKMLSNLEDTRIIPKDAVVEIQALIPKVMSYLEDVKQYSDHLVQAMMELTQQSEKQFSKKVQYIMHLLVKILLTGCLTEVQKQWDSDHNVSKRLETQQEYLWKQFQYHANKLDATSRLSMAFCDLLERHNLVVAFEELITKSVSNKLHSEQWVCNWEVMRAYLDLHLIELVETNQIDKLLEFVSDGALLYKIVVGNFITKEISKQLKDGHKSFAWTRLRDTICDSVSTAAFEAGHPNPQSSPRPLIFQKSIIKSVRHISPEIARLVSINVSEELCSQYGDDIDFNQISNKVVEKVRGIRFNPTLSTSKVVDMVLTRMIQSQSDNIRPRSDAMCPHCHVTCLLTANHLDKHDALHQSQGLCGARYYYSKELLWSSCSKCIELGLKITPEDILFKDHWIKHYSESWKLPSNIMGMTKVREYIFANFQEELLKKYRDCNACSDIPPHFQLLKLEELRVELDSVILSRA